MMSFRRVRAIAGKEIRQPRRDRLTLGMVVGVPLLQILLFGFAINMDVRHLSAGVADLAGTASSRALVGDLATGQVVDVEFRTGSAAQLEDLLRRGDITVGIVIPPDFERRLADPARRAAHLLVDGSDPSILSVAQRLMETPPPGGAWDGGGSGLFELRAYYNPERRSAVQIVPALIGVILTLTMVLFTSVAIVRERERGNLEFLITTPVTTLELMLGKLLPYVVIGILQVTLILIVGELVFDVPFRGSVGQLYLASAAFIAASLTLGLLISTVARTQFQAMQMTIFVFLPSILLSGFMFPFDGMPAAARHIAEVLPLTHFVRLVRGIVLRGASLWEMPGDLAALLVFFSVALVLALARFHKRLD